MSSKFPPQFSQDGNSSRHLIKVDPVISVWIHLWLELSGGHFANRIQRGHDAKPGIEPKAMIYTFSFNKKLGSGHRTKSFLISHEILSILVLKVS